MIDNEFVAAQFDATPADDDAAAALLLGAEPRLGYAPHPLIEPAWSRTFPRSSSKGPFRFPRVGKSDGVGDDCVVLEPASEWKRVAALPVTLAQLRVDALARAREFARQNAHSLRRDGDSFSPLDRAFPVDNRRVSVIMPVLNRADVIGRAIASVQNQTHTAWQLVIVDDGSTDNTVEVVRGLQMGDDRIVLVTHERSGVSAARNAGIARADGELIAFLDSDNVWRPTHLAACLAHLDDPKTTAVHSVVSVSHSNGRTTYAAHTVEPGALTEGRNPVDLNALVVGRAQLEAVGGFDESLRRWVDYDLVLRLARSLQFRLVKVIGVEYDHSEDARDRITTRESPLWRRVVLHRALVASAPPISGEGAGPLIVIRNRNCWPHTLTTAMHLLEVDGDIRIAVIDAASTRDNAAILGSIALATPRLTVTRTALDFGWTVSAGLAVRNATDSAGIVLAVRPGSTPTIDDLVAVMEAEAGMQHRRVRASGVLFACTPGELTGLAPDVILSDPLVAIE